MSVAPLGATTPPQPRKHLILEAPSKAEFFADTFTATGADIRRRLPIINGAAVEVDPGQEADLRKQAAAMGYRVYEDRKVTVPEGEEPGPEVDLNGGTWALDAGTRTMGARELWDKNITGKGVAVAVIDTGVAPHKDLAGRIVAFKDFTAANRADAYDDHGHGTHVSGTVAGDGKASKGWLKGMAPEANIVGVKVLDGGGSGEFSDVIAGIQWAVDNRQTYNIRVINLSLGAAIEESYKDDPVVHAIDAAAAAGVLPVVAAGNSGPFPETIGTPANAPDALTVAALDDRGTPWTWDDRMALFSSRGNTAIDGLKKPDVAAPGVAIMAARANSEGYTQMSGTSMAAPMVAGAAALLFQAHPEATPAQVKDAFMGSADSLWGYSEKAQGKGSVRVPDALAKLES
ncbi:MAG: S8 family peptidase [Armatimonadetes bacterium]|nr:S8 family peptidase [Armatimonadota bacterium]